MMKTNFQPKIGLKQPNVLTQWSQPSIWVEKITQRFLECMLRSHFIDFEINTLPYNLQNMGQYSANIGQLANLNA